MASAAATPWMLSPSVDALAHRVAAALAAYAWTAEMCVAAVVPDAPVLAQLTKDIVSLEYDDADDPTRTAILLITTYASHLEDLSFTAKWLATSTAAVSVTRAALSLFFQSMSLDGTRSDATTLLTTAEALGSVLNDAARLYAHLNDAVLRTRALRDAVFRHPVVAARFATEAPPSGTVWDRFVALADANGNAVTMTATAAEFAATDAVTLLRAVVTTVVE
jgi:hypothetical protein